MLECDLTQLSQSALSKQSVHSGKTSTRQDISVGYFVLPGYAQDTADASLFPAYVGETGASSPTGHVRHLAFTSLQFFFW